MARSVQTPAPGERGHLQHVLVSAIRFGSHRQPASTRTDRATGSRWRTGLCARIYTGVLAAMMTLTLAACGGGNEEAPRAIAESGPGTFAVGTVVDGKRLCALEVVATGKLRLAAEVRGLEGEAYWRVQVNGGLPSTGKVIPDGAGGAAAEWEADVAAGDRVEVELYAIAVRPATSATWQSAALRAW